MIYTPKPLTAQKIDHYQFFASLMLMMLGFGTFPYFAMLSLSLTGGWPEALVAGLFTTGTGALGALGAALMIELVYGFVSGLRKARGGSNGRSI
jgi:hypothetical protein